MFVFEHRIGIETQLDQIHDGAYGNSDSENRIDRLHLVLRSVLVEPKHLFMFI